MNENLFMKRQNFPTKLARSQRQMHSDETDRQTLTDKQTQRGDVCVVMRTSPLLRHETGDNHLLFKIL